MKITGITAHEVGIPMQGVLLWAYSFSQHGYKDHIAIATPRTILEVHTDEGLTGIGEGNSPKEYFEKTVARRIKGADPFHWRAIIAPEKDPHDRAGLEFAMWDLMGKYLGKPVAALLGGGQYQREVQFSAYVFFRLPNMEGKNEVNLENHAEHCLELVKTYGFRSLKLKLGVYPYEDELRAVRRVRQVVGPGPNIRIDPNSAWNIDQAINAARVLEDVGIEYLEDVARGLEDQARLRAATQIPVCADGSYSLERLSHVIRQQAAEVAMCDIYGSGGIAGVKDWVTVARTFGLRISMHSGRWLGVSHAAKLHAAAASGPFHFPIDAHYHQQADDVLKGGLMKYGPNGTMQVPDKPGLGIELDPERLERWAYTEERKRLYAQYYRELQARYGHLGQGDYQKFLEAHVNRGGRW